MKVVFDTNVLLSATLWNGSVGQKLLFKLIMSKIPIYSSISILEEYEKVFKRDFNYSNEEVAQITEKLLPILKLVNPQIKLKVVVDDPDDNKIIECALEAGAEFIITYDKHLLKLKEYSGIKIIKPEEALHLV